MGSTPRDAIRVRVERNTLRGEPTVLMERVLSPQSLLLPGVRSSLYTRCMHRASMLGRGMRSAPGLVQAAICRVRAIGAIIAQALGRTGCGDIEIEQPHALLKIIAQHAPTC